MARKFSFSTYDKRHLRNLLRRATQITKLFNDAARQGSRLGEASGFRDPKGEFFLDNYPALKEQVEGLFKELHGSLLAVITEGNREEWLLSAAKNDAMIDSLFGHVAKYGERAKEWKEPNLKALQKFTERKERGLNLSDRVWKMTHQFKGELEMALELGLGEGKSAAALSRDVRQYLNEPSKLFRRVRNEKGQLRLSKAAQAYNPGQGVYRSSYKNALRLTATENNMAYRTADHERWQQLDFVIGIQIKLSNNHTCNGKPFVDICDTLQGTYPKTFKFVGWHPFCRCIAVPKLADEDEFIAQQQAMIDGDESEIEFSGVVTEMPKNFTEWVQENASRIKGGQNEPYFIRDNAGVIDNILNPDATASTSLSSTAKRTPPEIAAERHAARRPEDAERIQTEWNRRRLWNANDGIEQLDLFHDSTYQELIRLLENDIALGDHKAFEHDFAEMKRMINAAREVEYLNTERLMRTPLFKANNDALESTFGARGTAMPFRPANQLRGNPHYAESSTYRVNCQTCVVANELRRRGFDLEALANTKGSALEALSYHTESAWVDAAGKIPTSNVSGLRKVMRKRWDGTEYEVWEKTCKNRKQMVTALESAITEDGRYHIKWTWAKGNCGHIITVERIGGKFRYYDPQNGKVITDFVGYINGIKTGGGIRWLRVDTLRVNPDIAKKILTKPTTTSSTGKVATGGTSGIVTPLSESQKNRRAEIREIARAEIANKPIMIPGINRSATISSGKIKEWLNQPHEHIIEKNESLLNLADLISKGEYVGYGIDKHDPTAIAHLVRVKIAGDDSWVVIRELNDGSIRIHSISDNRSIVYEIIKKKP